MKRLADINFLVLLSLAGLLSGILTASLRYPLGQNGFYFLGGVFGVIIAIMLAVLGVIRSFWKPFVMTVVAAGAFYISFMVAGYFQLFLPSVGNEGISLFSMFVGGLVGALVLLSTFLVLINPPSENVESILAALRWSPVGGALGVIGWVLGPSLGMIVWDGVRNFGLTAPDETFRNAAHGETSHMFSLYVVWQAGMAVVLGLALRSPHSGGSDTKAFRNPLDILQP